MNPLRPLTIPTYRWLFAAMVLTIFAQGAWALYLAMQTLDLGATPATLSGVVVWSGIGLLAGSLPAGVLADRIPNKSVIVGVLSLNLAIATATSTVAVFGMVAFWMLAASAFFIGVSTAFFFPAYTALVPVLVESDDLMAVNGLEGAIRPLVGQALAPAAVGAVIGVSMPAAGGYLIAAALAVALLAALQLPAPTPAESEADASAASPIGDLLDGFGYAARTRWVRTSVLFAAVMGLVVTGPLEVLLPALMRSSHENGPALYGAVLAALGVGGLVGSLLAGSWCTPERFLPAMIGAWALGCLPLTIPALTSNPWAIGVGLAIYGALIGIGMVIWGTVLQEHVPLEMLGRVASLDFFISIAFMPLSIALTGLLSRHIDTHTLFISAGLVPLVMAVLLATLGQLRMPRTTVGVADGA
ncbi:arabinose ABC transporter permease [Micrococcus luteus]|uniref:DHA3 family tetracycline resistance protein-like MFS transporter n=1 Tax=Micrococcus cohnii TaxID=993416 RepID=A0A7W7M409_9MICC|nr:MFS transporter [Micrococcus luteus]MBB4736200.1 DHA3 family tetracycline resistance protein-like MFS transporter [Micrococcus cohnii]MCV7613642.1 MFS transporter [Micrococcus luteus]PMC36155.1 arabinose ABC transporter permease [Micrococcus luteus]TWH35499.1 putative MFS family arabinose efflux permease [Micrococcus luteus J28]